MSTQMTQRKAIAAAAIISFSAFGIEAILLKTGYEMHKQLSKKTTQRDLETFIVKSEGRLHVAREVDGILTSVSSCIYQNRNAYRINLREWNTTYTLYQLQPRGPTDVYIDGEPAGQPQTKTALELYKKTVPEMWDTSGLAATAFEKW